MIEPATVVLYCDGLLIVQPLHGRFRPISSKTYWIHAGRGSVVTRHPTISTGNDMFKKLEHFKPMKLLEFQ